MGQLGRFTIEEELGRGAMGIVYRAMHPGLGVPVAIKVLSEQYSADPAFRRRFQREAVTIAALNHPGIVRVYDFDQDGGSLFIVMEFVEGRSLRAWLEDGGRFTVEASLDLVRQLLAAAGVAHARGIIHRDLKPENILLTDEGRLKVLDFGIAAMLDDSFVTTTPGGIAGTPSYMSPEQGQGGDIDRRSDIYAIGIMLYELLHGQPPFVGSIPSVLRSQLYDQPPASDAIPRSLMDVIWKAMAKAPDQRYAACEEFSAAISARAQLGGLVQPRAGRKSVHMLTAQVGAHNVKPQIEARPAASNGEPKSGVCRHTGCLRAEGWRCAYRDQAKGVCNTYWCKEHVQFADGTPFCRRHASVVRALLPTDGTIRELKVLPAVGDRSLSLAALVCSDVEKEILQALVKQAGGRRGLKVVSDVSVRQGWVGRREIAWERSWSVLHGASYALRIVIRVAVSKPTVVQISDGTKTVELIPDWIVNRIEGKAEDAGDRGRFKARVLGAVEEAVKRGQPALTPGPPPIKPSRQKLSRS